MTLLPHATFMAVLGFCRRWVSWAIHRRGQVGVKTYCVPYLSFSSFCQSPILPHSSSLLTWSDTPLRHVDVNINPIICSFFVNTPTWLYISIRYITIYIIYVGPIHFCRYEILCKLLAVSYRSHPANMCARSASYRSHPVNVIYFVLVHIILIRGLSAPKYLDLETGI